MSAHPAASLFPMMSDDELRALADDIREHGLRQPIVCDEDGLILDGRNRFRACELAEVQPQLVTRNPADPVALVVSLNVKRRNMTKQQLAVSAAQAWDLAPKVGRGSSGTAKALSEMFGVSTGYIEQARALVERAPEAAEAVKAGMADLRLAYDALLKAERDLASDAERAERAQREADALRARLEAGATFDVTALPPPTEEELRPPPNHELLTATAQTIPASWRTPPSHDLKDWERRLTQARQVAAGLRELSPYPVDADALLVASARATARSLCDAAARIVRALPNEQPAIRRVK